MANRSEVTGLPPGPRQVPTPDLSPEPLRWAVVAIGPGSAPALVVSYEPFHPSGLVTICPITPARDSARAPARHPGDVRIPGGWAGLATDGVIVCSQIRTIHRGWVAPTRLGQLTDPARRREVRRALAQHLALDVPGVADEGSAP